MVGVAQKEKTNNTILSNQFQKPIKIVERIIILLLCIYIWTPTFLEIKDCLPLQHNSITYIQSPIAHSPTQKTLLVPYHYTQLYTSATSREVASSHHFRTIVDHDPILFMDDWRAMVDHDPILSTHQWRVSECDQPRFTDDYLCLTVTDHRNITYHLLYYACFRALFIYVFITITGSIPNSGQFSYPLPNMVLPLDTSTVGSVGFR